MKLIFAGTPEFAARALDSLNAAGREIGLVLTQPDRPAGRGMKPLPSPVKRLAQARGLPVLEPASLRDEAVQQALRAVGADLMVVAAYGLILPQSVLDIARLGALNIHASLLPRWRGAAPIQRALLAGDRDTGICIMRMDAGLDTGPVLLRETVAINDHDTAQSLHERLATLGARLIVRAVDDLEGGKLVEQPQAVEGVTYARKIAKLEAKIDWTSCAAGIDRCIRAFMPHPGAHSTLRGAEIKLWQARVAGVKVPAQAAPGQVLEADKDGITVACGEGTLKLLQLQRPGGRRLAAAEFLRGFAIVPGDRFGA